MGLNVCLSPLFLFWYESVLLPKNHENLVVTFLTFYCCTKYCLSLSISELQEHASPIVLCCGTERALFTNKLSKHWCGIICLTSLQRWFSRDVKFFLLCPFSAHHQTLLPHQVSGVGLFQLVRFASVQTEEEEKEEDAEQLFKLG